MPNSLLVPSAVDLFRSELRQPLPSLQRPMPCADPASWPSHARLQPVEALSAARSAPSANVARTAPAAERSPVSSMSAAAARCTWNAAALGRRRSCWWPASRRRSARDWNSAGEPASRSSPASPMSHGFAPMIAREHPSRSRPAADTGAVSRRRRRTRSGTCMRGSARRTNRRPTYSSATPMAA